MRVSPDTPVPMIQPKTHPSFTPALTLVPEAASATAQRCVLAMTRLASGVTATAVADIFKRTRDRHRDLAIVGAMLFDGERFGLLLCGPSAQVDQTLAALAVDARQAPPVVLADGPNVPSWAAQGWRSGWSEPDALAALAAADAPRDDAALQAWRVLIGASDLL